MAETIITTVADEGSLGVPVDAALAENTVDTSNDGTTSLTELLAEPDAASETVNPAADQALDKANDRQARATAGRVKEAERRAYQRARDDLSKEFDLKLNERLAPLMAAHVENTAREIAASENVSIEVARELAAYRQGGAKQSDGIVPQSQAKAELRDAPQGQSTANLRGGNAEQGEARPRDERGRFQASQPADGGLSARGAFLREQAAEIKTEYGIDMLPLFRDDPEIRDKVSQGKWDFWRALAAYDKRGGVKRTPTEQEPPVIRSSNLADTRVSVEDMDDADIDKVLRAVKRGKAVRFE
jgi:hypothetical protein